MNIWEKIERFLGFTPEDEETETGSPETETPKAPPVEKTKETPKNEYVATNVVDFKSAASNKEESTVRPNKFVKSAIKTIQPQSYDDSQIISNYLRKKITVIVNFEKTDATEATRIADFIFGTIYALDGKGKQIGEKVFIFAPDTVTIEAYEDEKKSKGTFFD